MCIICNLSQTFDPMRHGPDHPLSGEDTSSLTALERSGATDVAVGDTTSGTISFGGEQDVFEITLEAGQGYLISALGSSTGGGTLSDTDLHIYDSSGNLITYNDGTSSNGFDASAVFTASATGTYYIMVDSYYSTRTGSYQLQVEESILPPSGSDGTYEELSEYLQNEGQGEGAETMVSSSTVTVNISALTDLGQQMAQWAMEAWEMVAGVDFQIVTSGEMVTVDDLNDVTSDNPNGYQAWAYYGAQGNNNGIEMMVSESWFDFGTTMDSYAFQTYVHEFGHILGLHHLGPYNGTATFGQDNYFSNDSYQVSVMSYFSQTENPNVDASFSYVAGPMIADILAIQDFYGAPGSSGVTAGNTIFGLNSNLGNYMDTLFDALATGATSDVITGNRMAFTLYDQGGTDLVDLSFADSGTDINLNLNEGIFSDYGTHIGAFNIAIGTVIENATTGAGDDTVTGNDANNIIRGGGGNDTLYGGVGNDVLVGGSGGDVLNGGTGVDRAQYLGASAVTADLLNSSNNTGAASGDTYISIERLYGTAFGDGLYGDHATNAIWGHNGNDFLSGRGGNDALYGGAGNDVLVGGSGGDVLNGGAGYDRAQYLGGSRVTADLLNSSNNRGNAIGDTYISIERLYGSAFNDSLLGDHANNAIWGHYGSDDLFGRGGNDALYGGVGTDDLYGGAGNDLLSGGGGADKFVFFANSGDDKIVDFQNNYDK
ncbi:pre-peptidase C-terminal domain-containing protein, partial [Halocynthiibacter styelae]